MSYKLLFIIGTSYKLAPAGELANKIYYMDAQTGKFFYKDEYGTQEDFFNRAKDLPKEKNRYTFKEL